MRLEAQVVAVALSIYASGHLMTAAPSWAATLTPAVAVGPQYDTAHV